MLMAEDYHMFSDQVDTIRMLCPNIPETKKLQAVDYCEIGFNGIYIAFVYSPVLLGITVSNDKKTKHLFQEMASFAVFDFENDAYKKKGKIVSLDKIMEKYEEVFLEENIDFPKYYEQFVSDIVKTNITTALQKDGIDVNDTESSKRKRSRKI